MVQGILFGLRPAVVAMIASSGVSLLLLAFYGQSLLPADPLRPDWVAVGLLPRPSSCCAVSRPIPSGSWPAPALPGFCCTAFCEAWRTVYGAQYI